MAGLGAIWVALRERENDLERVKSYYRNQAQLVKDEDGFVCVDNNVDIDESPSETLQNFSEEFGEAFFIGFQSTVDYFIYAHWRGGEMLRELFYYSDEGWITVQGEPEEWEAMWLFSEKNLEFALEDADEETAENLRKLWKRKELEEGQFFPMLSARETCYDLMNFYKLAAAK